MKKEKIAFGFNIVTESGPLPKPVAITVAPKRDNTKYSKPLKYMADALTGLSLIRLNSSLQCPLNKGDLPVSECHEAWNHLDPHHTLYQRSQQRVQSLKSKIAITNPQVVSSFEKTFTETLNNACKPEGIDLKDLWPLLDAVTFLENKISSPLLFNFGISLSKAFVDKCHALYCLLFHVRTLIAIDHNGQQVEDTSQEALKVDSITDYLPRAEYIVNDAMLYYHFRKLSHPFLATRQSDVKVEKLLVEPMQKHFEQFTHDAVCLIDQLPTEFLEKFRANDMEEALHLVQMDWLLGSEAGLLFRFREELFGLLNGYEKIFWHEKDGRKVQQPARLTLHFELSKSDWSHGKAA
jgi:hypothetical protein